MQYAPSLQMQVELLISIQSGGDKNEKQTVFGQHIIKKLLSHHDCGNCYGIP